MKLSTDYLKERHAYWKDRLDEDGVWDAKRFYPVSFEIRPFSKTYNALCINKFLNSGFKTIIRFYCQDIEVSSHWIDSILVHEMIHQYIFQNDIQDSSVHGSVFRQYMNDINELFPDELNINISCYSERKSGPGKKIHKLILLRLNDDRAMWCLAESFRYDYFIKKAADAVARGDIKAVLGCESNDVFFNYHTCCRKAIRGVKMSISELRDFCKCHNVRLSSCVN